MKKFTKILVLTAALMAILAVASFASPHGIIENEPVDISAGNVTIDGFINEDEGYSEPALANYDTLGYYWAHNPLSTNASIYYTFNDDGIVVGVDVIEGLEAIDERDGTDLTGLNQFNYSTGEDDLDRDVDTGANDYGWNGDVIGLMFDPLGALIGEGFSGSSDLSANYLIGLFQGADGEADYTRVYRAHSIEDKEITDLVVSAGRVTEEGWMIEIMIPWDLLIEDVDWASMSMVQLNKEMIIANGAIIRTNFLYQDRFYDDEQGAVATWGRYMTAPATLNDGTPGHMGSGEGIASYGIKLVVNSIEFPDVPKTGTWYSEGVYYCASKGYITGTDKGEFNPNGKLTREQFVVILARVAGADLTQYTVSKFADVKATSWYGPSVIWANESEYVNGVGDGTKFGVGQDMTREQLATMFFRYAKGNGVNVEGKADLSDYTDVATIGSWAKDACAWAVDAGLLSSTKTDAKVLSPKMSVTRAQAAKIFMSYDAFAQA
ncbi:MAG: S-layer homology domain-containing protein [Ruminococcaceae bacterium]|nr:S-layer homology domain-containing protein [Oscillospiraceae bacterium]